MADLVEPSNAEQAEWPEATRAYVSALEAEVATCHANIATKADFIEATMPQMADLQTQNKELEAEIARKDARIAEQAKEIERLASLAKANNDLARMEVAYRKQLAFQRAEMANALEAVTSQYGDRLPAQFLADLTAMLMRPALRAGVVVEKHDDA